MIGTWIKERPTWLASWAFLLPHGHVAWSPLTPRFTKIKLTTITPTEWLSHEVQQTTDDPDRG